MSQREGGERAPPSSSRCDRPWSRSAAGRPTPAPSSPGKRPGTAQSRLHPWCAARRRHALVRSISCAWASMNGASRGNAPGSSCAHRRRECRRPGRRRRSGSRRRWPSRPDEQEAAPAATPAAALQRAFRVRSACSLLLFIRARSVHGGQRHVLHPQVDAQLAAVMNQVVHHEAAQTLIRGIVKIVRLAPLERPGRHQLGVGLAGQLPRAAAALSSNFFTSSARLPAAARLGRRLSGPTPTSQRHRCTTSGWWRCARQLAERERLGMR